MSWISDAMGGYVSGLGNFYAGLVQAGSGRRDVADWIKSETVDKASLRGAQVEGFLSGLPYIGGVVKGIDNVQQMDDLYNNTGQVSAYAGVQSSGLSSAGKSVPGLARKIEAGTHDLFEHYSGTKDDTIESLIQKGIIETGDQLVARSR